MVFHVCFFSEKTMLKFVRKPKTTRKDYKKSLFKPKTAADRVCKPWDMRGKIGERNESSAKYDKNKDTT